MNDASPRKIKVLLCEDEPLILMALVDLLNEFGMEALEAGNEGEALAILSSNEVDVFVTDVGLPDVSGLELAIQARNLKPDLPIAFSTGDRHVEGAD